MFYNIAGELSPKEKEFWVDNVISAYHTYTCLATFEVHYKINICEILGEYGNIKSYYTLSWD